MGLPMEYSPLVLDFAGTRQGKLEAVAPTTLRWRRKVVWLWRCDCGKTIYRSPYLLRLRDTKSCGCAIRTQHGHARTNGERSPTWRSWWSMISRCTYQSNRAWPQYGGRGITVCQRWRESFPAFLADMGERPPGKTIDRMNNLKGYEPGNCRWATHSEQMLNRRSWSCRS